MEGIDLAELDVPNIPQVVERSAAIAGFEWTGLAVGRFREVDSDRRRIAFPTTTQILDFGREG